MAYIFKRISLFGLLLVAVIYIGGSTQAHDEDFGTDTPTYWHDVKPILEANCVTCHTEDDIGGFPLTTYEETVEAAPALGEAVLTGYMPPWLPGGDTPALVGDRGLTEAEINTLLRWALTGEEGDPADYDHADIEAQAPQPEVRADLELEMPVVYTPDTNLTDDYRCFLIDPGLDEDRFVTGYNIIPDQASIVHHVLLFLVPQSAREQALQKEAKDGRPGWTCFGGSNLEGANEVGSFRGLSRGASFAGSIGAWAPGSGSVFFPEGTGNLLLEDDLIVMQVHYNLEAGALPDQTKAVLQLAELDADIYGLGGINLVAPVEIPCPADADSPLCDRQEMILDRARNSENPNRVLFSSQGLLAACRKTLADYEGQTAENVISSCEQQIRVDGFAVGVAGHMHELGTRVTIELNPDSEDAQVMLDIPAWDFHWQDSYRYLQPIPISRGDVVEMTCYWDNSEGDRYIVWGEGTKDEMCLGGISVLPLPDGMTHAEFVEANPGLFAVTNPHDTDHTHSQTFEVGGGNAVPTLNARVIEDSSGYILLLDVENFEFAPENVDGEAVIGEGHAHLYIDGEKITRLYDTAYSIGELPAGTHEIMVTLNANNHAELTVAGEPVMAMVMVEVE